MGGWGRSPHGQIVVKAMPPSRPHGNFAIVFSNSKMRERRGEEGEGRNGRREGMEEKRQGREVRRR